MNFYGVRELSNNTKTVLSSVSRGKKAIITDNGKPTAIMLGITEDTFEQVLSLVQRMEGLTALSLLQQQSASEFPKGLSDDEIQAEINAARKGE